jgi:hypothetical protein
MNSATVLVLMTSPHYVATLKAVVKMVMLCSSESRGGILADDILFIIFSIAALEHHDMKIVFPRCQIASSIPGLDAHLEVKLHLAVEKVQNTGVWEPNVLSSRLCY